MYEIDRYQWFTAGMSAQYPPLSVFIMDVVPALPDGRRLQPGWIRQSEGDHANWYRCCRCRQGNSLVKEVKKKQLCVTSNVSLCSCPESRRGGRVCPTSRRHSQQDLRRSPGQGWAAGRGPRQTPAEQRSKGDPDGGQAAKWRQIIWRRFRLSAPFMILRISQSPPPPKSVNSPIHWSL